MAVVGSRIHPTSFKISIGFLLALALLLASARTYLRVRRFRRLFVDDYFLFFAVLTLTVGTSVLYVNLPYAYTQVNVESGLELPPADFVQRVVADERTQYPAIMFLWLAIFSVKFSFLFLFKSLIKRATVRYLTLWWWCSLVLLVPSAVICTCGLLIACSTFGASVVEACTTPQALFRENLSVKLSTVLDILTDVMLISIPVALLWRVKISLRKKLALGSVLCLSVFAIIISIVKVAAADIINGQVDSIWGIFWVQAEACIAVMAVSFTIFRSLFLSEGPRSKKPRGKVCTPQSPRGLLELKGNGESPPTVPTATYSGAKPSTEKYSWFKDRPWHQSSTGDVELPLQGARIKVTHDISVRDNTQRSNEEKRPSYESFV